MKRPPMGTAHLDTRILLDYLEERLDAASRAKVEAHLAGSCSRCRGRLFEVGRLVGAMRADRTAPIPEELRRRALSVFQPRPAESEQPWAGWRVARLQFDSLSAPLPAPVRRAVGEARWLRFALESRTIEIEVEPEALGAFTLRGCLTGEEPALYRIDVEVAGETCTAWPDAAGRFALERVPAGPASIRVRGPEDRWRLPRLTL